MPSRRFIADAQDKGAKVATGGKRIGNQGNFFQPTVLTDVPENARIMNEEPFGPVAVMLRFKETDDVLARANKLPFGLASYAFTKDAKTATKVADALDSGMVTINHFGIALPETPFGGVKDFGLRPRRRHRGPARSTCRPSSSATWADRAHGNAEGGDSIGELLRPNRLHSGAIMLLVEDGVISERDRSGRQYVSPRSMKET